MRKETSKLVFEEKKKYITLLESQERKNIKTLFSESCKRAAHLFAIRFTKKKERERQRERIENFSKRLNLQLLPTLQEVTSNAGPILTKMTLIVTKDNPKIILSGTCRTVYWHSRLYGTRLYPLRVKNPLQVLSLYLARILKLKFQNFTLVEYNRL